MSEAGAGVHVPPRDETREILQPSLLPVPDNSGLGEGLITTSDHYCVCNGVRYGTRVAVIINVTSIMITSLYLTLTLFHI